MIFLLILTPLVYCAFFFFGDAMFMWGSMSASAPTRHDIAKLLISAYRHGVLYKTGPGQIDDQRGKQQHDAEVEQRRQQIRAALLQQGIGAGLAVRVVGVDAVDIFLGLPAVPGNRKQPQNDVQRPRCHGADIDGGRPASPAASRREARD